MGFGCAVTVILATCCGAVDDGVMEELADALEEEVGEELGGALEDEDVNVPLVCTVPDTV